MSPWTPRACYTNMTRVADSARPKLAAFLEREAADAELARRLADPSSQESADALSAKQEAARIEDIDETEPDPDDPWWS